MKSNAGCRKSILEERQSENAEIWWGDETAFKPEAHTRRSSPKTPVWRQPPDGFTVALSVLQPGQFAMDGTQRSLRRGSSYYANLAQSSSEKDQTL